MTMAQETGSKVADTPEIANYRYYRRMMWQTVRSRFAVALAEAMATGPEGEARKVAARAVRGDVRSFMSELLTHAPVPALVRFLAVARVWGESGELLLGTLIESVETTVPWPGPAPLGREAAEDDAKWLTWVQTWLAAFRSTGPAAAAVAPAMAAPPGPQDSKRRAWVPWALSAAVSRRFYRGGSADQQKVTNVWERSVRGRPLARRPEGREGGSDEDF
jgi:hypothetical protein